MIQTIDIQGTKYTGEIVEGALGYINTLIIDGKPLMGVWKQGYTGTKRYDLPVRFVKTNSGGWRYVDSFVNGSRQVKDPTMYFLGVKP